MPARLNLMAGWIGIVLGFVSGAVPGLYFWREEWLGGYASWKRRMVRLGHISFFGLGFINIFFALSATVLAITDEKLRWSSPLLVGGAIAMPLVCYLSAWRMRFRHLFVVPVACMLIGVALFIHAGFI